ncbi:MAG: hypothetical protein WA240_03105, partial [Nitrospirota bacterium]
LLQNCLSSPNAFIGDMVFQALRTRFPLRNSAGMTELGFLQEPLLIKEDPTANRLWGLFCAVNS